MILESSPGHDHSEDNPEINVPTPPTPAVFNLVKELMENGAELTKVREYFSKGHLGQQVFDFVIRRNNCESYIIDPEGKEVKCEEIAIGSVDFDAGGIGDVVLVCSRKCFEITTEKIRAETIAQGRPTIIGINGFGRT